MNREIKIRYTFKRKSDNHIWQEIVPIEFLEGKGDKPFILNDWHKEWDLISRDFYTGLPDKNGNDIYEGDFISGVAIDKPALVSWHNHFASFCLNANGWAYSHWFGESCNPEKTEIIGNIHSNPELLQK